MDKKQVCAVVPCYNEASRIADVLKSLSKSKLLDEIIVIDDGSKDTTSEIIRKFPKIRYIKNERNKGKAYAMNRGVKNTNAEIIFFCDADLKGLTPEIVDEIVAPVVNNKYDMFIGLRNNFTQRLWKYTALCSGERALKRKIWINLPDFYKRGYRIETGLNEYTKIYGKGFGYKKFRYYQTGSEKKRGTTKGILFRIKMFYGVFSGMLVFKFHHRFKGLKKI